MVVEVGGWDEGGELWGWEGRKRGGGGGCVGDWVVGWC